MTATLQQPTYTESKKSFDCQISPKGEEGGSVQETKELGWKEHQSFAFGC